MRKFVLLFILHFLFACSSPLVTHLEKSNYSKLTSYNELIDFVKEAENKNHFIKSEYFAVSVEGRKIPVLKISKDSFNDKNKLKVMIFAQQHGNEQSGKEGSLLLIKEIANGNLNYLFDRLDLLLVPQVNPDGSEKNKRRNGNDFDLNRNHLILSETETTGLHNLFYQYLPEATMDVHEYSPYSKSWTEFGYLKNYDEQIGTLTNPNISKNIINVQKKQLLDYYKKHLAENGFSSNEYLLGGPPGINRMRFSTIDVNDGRQSFGILNSFSFIQEGKSGRDSIDNIESRAKGQYEGMLGYLEFLYENNTDIKLLVKTEREQLLNPSSHELVIIRLEHVPGDKSELVKLNSIKSGSDTVFTVEDFNSKIETRIAVEKPNGYLIPKSDEKLKLFIEKHHLNYFPYVSKENEIVVKYNILKIGKKIEEDDEHSDPTVKEEVVIKNSFEEYWYVPLNQLASTLIVIALEPQSMLGIMQYPEYDYLLKNKTYPIFKVVNKE